MVNQIYLLSTKADKKTFQGCKIIVIDYFNSALLINEIQNYATGEYALLYTKTTPLELKDKALQKMASRINTGICDMVYSDHYEWKDGECKEHPLNDYQLGSVRDDFDFGSLIMFSTISLKAASIFIMAGILSQNNLPFDSECMDILMNRKGRLKYAGLYATRLFISSFSSIKHIKEYLYTEYEEDLRLSGEKQFDYVNPKNREVQLEMERVFTSHLKSIGAYLNPVSTKVDFSKEAFDTEASVIIPVKNRVRTIKDAIESVLSQETDFAFNVIIVDNHSDDGTTQAIASYQDNPKIIHIQPERTDLGIGGCWDLAANHPQCGRFAVQLDSDDIYSSPQTLQKIIDGFYQQGCGMLIGSYRITDFDLNTLPPGLIDHKEWTDENGHNNALRINGLGAPRAFYTPLLRKIGVPNVSYGEDYALGLAFSRQYKIGRIYDELYLCRRWEGNSDAALSIEKTNRNNQYKDSLRTKELKIRFKMNERLKEKNKKKNSGKEVLSFIKEQLKEWEIAKDNTKQLKDLQVKSMEVAGLPVKVQFNPARIGSTTAKTDTQSIQKRACFLCQKNQPKEQRQLDVTWNLNLCVNPYPIVPGHLTIPAKKHTPQHVPTYLAEVYDLFKQLPTDYAVFYNGPYCGASAPDHFHFQAISKKYIPLIAQYNQLKKSAKPIATQYNYINSMIGRCKSYLYYINGYACPLFAIESKGADFDELFKKLWDQLPISSEEWEPKMNIFIWKGKGLRSTNLLIIPRSKHRPDCYEAENENQLLVSPGALDMAGIIITPREEDFHKITSTDVESIIKEVGLPFDEADQIAENILKEKV